MNYFVIAAFVLVLAIPLFVWGRIIYVNIYRPSLKPALRESPRLKQGVLLSCSLIVFFVLLSGWWLYDHRTIDETDGLGARLDAGVNLSRYRLAKLPVVYIKMYGFVDSGFDAYMVDGFRRKRIFSNLATFPSDVRAIPPPGILAEEEWFRKDLEGMYQVVWSRGHQRLGIAYKGHLVAVYDVESKAKLQWYSGDSMMITYKEADKLLERFLNGGAVVQDDLYRKDIVPQFSNEPIFQ